ncbi:probable ADP-ribosylation factor GTPase-activating protein AGD14 [Lotus japonicus]|uniref:probable ADP-ribosylation factor GTPase-activating protein AGD14 n=1 Tax=Lotus japonicus TaxID=34305 RepID=UPI00258BBE50|nr:probable ADP-ribosylation factor GTPase-activating protein AGD14 [Lotus japonicus]XP_057447106.1 probable ADP-ribosylation factor GTPase-activating protein AGD14 [Lotus japonicus]
MASRKEDEKNERVIRGLLKLESNRRCINCNSLGPQYVCTNFWTFVCTNCSGIHREFTHRVKSISMAKFTSQEVIALQEGGNQRAKEIYFKEWDAQHQSSPDSNNVNRLRDFIKHVYVDRRYTGDKTSDKPPKVKAGDKDDSYKNRRAEAYQGGSRSPPYEDTYERRYSDRSSPGGRSPGYDQESRQYGDYKRSPGRPPIINDWRREDRRTSDGDYKVESQSPERVKDLNSSSPPVVRPVRDILGDNVVPLRISEPPKPNSGRAADGSSLTQRTASSGSLASSIQNTVEVKLETAKSLIDFDADPEPIAPAIPQAQQITLPQPVMQPANSSGDNWASFDIASEAKATPSPSNLNPLESVLSQLSVPASSPAHSSGVQGPIPALALSSASGAASVSGFSVFQPSGASVPSSGLATASPLNNVGQWANLQHKQPLFPAAASQPTTQQFARPVGGAVNNQPWSVPSVPTVQGHPSTQMPDAYHHASNPGNEAINNIVSQPSTVEIKPSGRIELPEDLFTFKYPSYPAPVRGWQMGHPHGMGISMQYSNVVPVPSFPQPSKSTNPFDVSSKPTPDQAPTFPSMSSLQGALPNVPSSGANHPSSLGNAPYAWTQPPSAQGALSSTPPSGTMHPLGLGNQSHAWTPPMPSLQGALPRGPPSGTLHPSSLGNASHAWTPPPSSSYVPVLPAQAQAHASAFGPSAYMGQQLPTNMPMPRQDVGSYGIEGDFFGLANPNQQPAGRFPITSPPNTFPAGGNPFG